MRDEERNGLLKLLAVIIRGFMLFMVLNFTATDFDGTEMLALLLFLSGDSVISTVKEFVRR